MELWVRSQDRDYLEKVEKIYFWKNSFGQYQIESNGSELGTYKTKERALEVLDEIQGKIAQNECIKTMLPMANDIKGYEEKFGALFKEMIYEMPND